jgi:hypothetical protein
MSRQKGRDFYDAIFLLSKTKPNMDFLKARTGLSSMEELKAAVAEKLREVDMEMKCRDFVHLLFNERNADRICQFPEVVAAL